MKKITLILISLFLTLGAVAQDYTPRNTGNKDRNDRTVSVVKVTGDEFDEQKYELTTEEQGKDYTDATAKAIFKVKVGETLTPYVVSNGSWVHFSVFVDYDSDGFTTGVTMTWRPTGDLVSYSFYNNGGGSDESGWNSVGQSISGNDRNMPALPTFKAPSTPGEYRMRFVQDWCSIDPAGDADGKFGDFKKNGGQIIDVILKVVEPAPLVENGKLYRIKNRCKDLSYLYATDNDHSNRGDGNGAYLSSTKRVIEGCQFLKSENEYDYKACEIRCDNATLADAGSVWKFEEAANGWKIKNMNNGSYIGATRNGSYVKFVKESDKAATFSITESGDYVTLYSADYNNGTNNNLHASGAGLMIWNASSTASHWTIEPATQLEVTVSSADYASIYLPFDVTLPEGENLKAYAVTSTKGGYAKLEEMTTGLPANNGAILEGAGTHTLNIEEATSDWDENLLRGSNVNTYVEGDAFVLANGENGVGLYKAALNKGENGADGDTHFLNNANKAYLPVSSTQGANMLRFDFGGETTGVDAVEVENNVKTIYDLSGRKVSNMSAPGLYIVNGKKVLVK